MSCPDLRDQLSAIKSLQESLLSLAPLKKEDRPVREQARALMKTINERIQALRESLVPKEFHDLLATEKQKLSAFFGQTIDVPPLPKDITLERFHEWKKLNFELHYLPPIEMKEESNFPGWTKKPGKKYIPGQKNGIEFFDEVRTGKLSPDALTLKPGWVLIDGRQRPANERGEQMYKKDPLAPIINTLRQGENPPIKKSEFCPDSSRFDISWDELHKPEVRLVFAKAIGLTPDQLSLPRCIEWNVLANLHHPEWDVTFTEEWFEDAHEVGRMRLVGVSGRGSLSAVHLTDPNNRIPSCGFRLIARFP